MFKGWKTVALSLGLMIAAWLQSPALKDAVGGCVFEFGATQPETCTFPWWIIAILSVLVLGLRLITSTPVGKK
jgi:hypothetical protein